MQIGHARASDHICCRRGERQRRTGVSARGVSRESEPHARRGKYVTFPAAALKEWRVAAEKAAARYIP